jgi:uncharacterized membrane protein
MSDRGLMFPIIGAVSSTIIAVLYRLGTGHFPNPIMLASLYLVGVGIGLIRARLDRLGPFGGLLGTPWFESDLHAALTREVARSLRFRRQLTVAAIRSQGATGVDWSDYLRLADQAFTCRNGWSILILAETPAEGAVKMMERVEAELGSELHAALLVPDVDVPIAKQIERDLMGLLTDPAISPNAGTRGLRRRYQPASS